MTTPSILSIPEGLCQCGCGQETKPAKNGHPNRYIHNHHLGQRPVNFDDAAPFKIDGVYCKLIPLTQGQYAIVEEDDYARISTHKWSARWCSGMQSYYAIRNGIIQGEPYTLGMHREILGLAKGDERQGDHIRSGDTLDNRRSNLRICTNNVQNQHNKRKCKRSLTGFKGVHKVRNRYNAIITVDGERKRLGTDKTPEGAHELYKAAALRYFGQYANDGENGLYVPKDAIYA